MGTPFSAASRCSSSTSAAGGALQAVVEVRIVLDQTQGGQTGSHGHRVAGQGPGLVHRPGGGQGIHHLRTAAKGSQGQAAAEDLAQGGQVGPDAEQFLGPAPGQAEPGDHLVKDQQGTVAVAQLPQTGEKAGARGDHSHIPGHRFHDHRGQPVAVLVRHLLHRLQVVERNLERGSHRSRYHPRAVRTAQGGGPGSGLHQKAVRMPVVTAVELDHRLAAGEPAGQPHRAHGGFGARTDQTHHFHRRNKAVDRLGQPELAPRWGRRRSCPERRRGSPPRGLPGGRDQRAAAPRNRHGPHTRCRPRPRSGHRCPG